MNRYLGALFLGACLSSTALVGCGDDSAEDGDDGGGSKAEVNEAAAASVASSSTQAIVALNSGEGMSAAGSLFAAAGSALAIAVPGGSSQQQSGPTGDLGIAASADCETACTGDATSGSCEFTGCEGLGFSVTGNLSWGDGHFDCDLTYGLTAAQEGQNVELDYHLVADIDYSATSIDGTLSMDGSSSAGGQEVSFDVDLVYNDVQFPAAGGCPTSGSLSVSASISSGGQSYDASGDVTFPVAGCTG